MNNIESNLNDIITDILAEAIIINEARNGVRPNGGIRGLLAGLKRARSQKNKSQARRYERALDKMGYDYRKKKGGTGGSVGKPSKKNDGFNGSSKEEMRHMNEWFGKPKPKSFKDKAKSYMKKKAIQAGVLYGAYKMGKSAGKKEE